MSWAQRRKATYALSGLLIVLAILAFIAFRFFNKKPTCFDGIKNGAETGVDCGGTCQLLCPAEYTRPSVQWVRWSKVLGSGSYNVLVYANNPNVGVGANNVPYTYNIYDRSGVLLYSGMGSTYIPPSANFGVFNDRIDLHDKVPARVSFNFDQNIVWQKINNKEINIIVVSKNLVNEDTAPKLEVALKNNDILPLQNIESIAVLYDQNDNAIEFSRTKIDSIDSEGTANIVFTWPEKFSEKIYKIEIISKVLPK